MALISGCSAVKLEREPLLSWAPTPKKDSFPMNYGVTHFGEDEDIKGTKVDIAWAENQLNHKLVISDPPKDPPRNYFVPHFGTDQEVLDHRDALTWAEKHHNHKLTINEFPAIKRNYFVPNFGEDSAITESKDSE